MRPLLIAPLCLTALLGACAETGADVEPILDGAPSPQFHSDVATCRSLARSQSQLDHEAMASAAIGAGIGGLLARPTATAMRWVGPLSAHWPALPLAHPRQATPAGALF